MGRQEPRLARDQLAGEIYGLQTLVTDVEDEQHNTTRFVVLSKDARWAAAGGRAGGDDLRLPGAQRAAALYKALGGFATNGVNMTKLESYMVEGEFTATQFLADVDGHPDDPPLRRALEELGFFSRELRILGVYPAHPFRAESQAGHLTGTWPRRRREAGAAPERSGSGAGAAFMPTWRKCRPSPF